MGRIKLEVIMDDEGVIREVAENGKPLSYDQKEDNRIEGSHICIRRNGLICCWFKVADKWICWPYE